VLWVDHEVVGDEPHRLILIAKDHAHRRFESLQFPARIELRRSSAAHEDVTGAVR